MIEVNYTTLNEALYATFPTQSCDYCIENIVAVRYAIETVHNLMDLSK